MLWWLPDTPRNEKLRELNGFSMHEGRHPGDVALECQHDQVGQQLQVLFVAGRCSLGRGGARAAAGGWPAWPWDGRAFFELGQPPLQLAHRGQVLVQLGPVARAQPDVQPVRLAAHQVEHALAVHAGPWWPPMDRRARGPGCRPGAGAGRWGARAQAAGEQAVEQRPRVGLLGHEAGGPGPRDVVQVGAAVPVLAVAGGAARADAHLQRGQPGVLLDVVGDHLVDRDAVLDVLAAVNRSGAWVSSAPVPRACEPANSLVVMLAGIVGQPGDHAELRRAGLRAAARMGVIV